MTSARVRVGVGVTALSFVLALVLGATGVVAPQGSVALGASTTVTVISGEIFVSHAGGPFEPAADGAILGPGDTIRTAADSRAVLTYFEGSTVSLEPATELRIDQAGSEPDGSTMLVMTQNLGRTWHVVTHLLTGSSRYDVRTPASTASVRGTAFEVGLVADPATGEIVSEVTTTEGAVATTAAATSQAPAPESVIVVAGFTLSVKAGEQRPAPPAPAPVPERAVTVTVGSDNSLVVDALGRANGVKDGRVVAQTPGAQVTRAADGTITVRLPNPRDGKLSTVVNRRERSSTSSAVEVVTTVEARGQDPVTVRETVTADAERVVTGVELRQGSADVGPELRLLRDEEKKELKTEKVAEAPTKPDATPFKPGFGSRPEAAAAPTSADTSGTGSTEAKPDESAPPPRPPIGLGQVGPASAATASESDKDKDKKEKAAEEAAAPGGFVPNLANRPEAAQLAQQAGDDARRSEDAQKVAEQIARAAQEAADAAERAQRQAERDRLVAERAQLEAAAKARDFEVAKLLARQAEELAAAEAKAAVGLAQKAALEREARARDEAARLEAAQKAAEREARQALQVVRERESDSKHFENAGKAAKETKVVADNEAKEKAKEAREQQKRAEELQRVRGQGAERP